MTSLSKEERYKLTRQRLKESDKRERLKRKEEFELMTPEEQLAAKTRRKMELSLYNERMKKAFSSSSGIKICVDMTLDCDHSDRERRSLCKQLCFVYGFIRKMEVPLKLYLTGICSDVQPQTTPNLDADSSEENLGLYANFWKQGIFRWDARVYNESVWDVVGCLTPPTVLNLPRRSKEKNRTLEDASSGNVIDCEDSDETEDISYLNDNFLMGLRECNIGAGTYNLELKSLVNDKVDNDDTAKEVDHSSSSSSNNDVLKKVILLSPDATEVLYEFRDDTLYVIGGIVDRSVRSARTLNLGKTYGVQCARLPIQEYIPNRQTHVCNIDTVVKIIGNYVKYNGDWKRSLEESMPLRKQHSHQ